MKKFLTVLLVIAVMFTFSFSSAFAATSYTLDDYATALTAEKTAQLSAGRQTAVEADKEEIQRYGAIRKVEQIMKKTIFEEMGGTYIRQGDYFIPCLTLPEEEEPRFVGVWGQRHL